MKRDRSEQQFVDEVERVLLTRDMNELVSDRGREQFEIAFAQQRFRQNDRGMEESDRDWQRQRLRAKHFYFARARAEFELAAMDDGCDAIVRIELDCETPDRARRLPGLH